MESALKSFERRQRAVAQKHRKLAQGYVTKINRNGVFEHRPIRRISPVRLRGLLLTILGFLVFKGVMARQSRLGELRRASGASVRRQLRRQAGSMGAGG